MINISVQSLEQILRASTISAEKKVYFQQAVKEFINLLISQMYTVKREGKKSSQQRIIIPKVILVFIIIYINDY